MQMPHRTIILGKCIGSLNAVSAINTAMALYKYSLSKASSMRHLPLGWDY